METVPRIVKKLLKYVVRSLDLAILGCNVSGESLEDAEKVFNKLRPSLHFSEEPFVDNLQSTKIEVFLRDNHFILSVLVMDGSTTSDSYDKQRWMECQRLVENIKDKVGMLSKCLHRLCVVLCHNRYIIKYLKPLVLLFSYFLLL